MKYRDILELVRKQSIYVDKKSLSYTAGLGKAGIKKSKEELIDAVMEYVSSCRDWLVEYMLECMRELALNPQMLEETIGCTEEERHRWTEDKRLRVVCNKEFGNEKFAPYYEIYQVAYEISDEILRKWREKDKKDDRLKPLGWKTKNYEYKNGFIVEVTERDSENGYLYDVFLSNIDYGEKKHMFGLLKKDIKDCDGLLGQILNNIDDHIEMYRDEVKDMEREDYSLGKEGG